jgi:hypothetical protein
LYIKFSGVYLLRKRKSFENLFILDEQFD